MSYNLTHKECELIKQKVTEIAKDRGVVVGFKTYEDIEDQVTTQYIQQRNALKNSNGIGIEPQSQYAGDKLERYEAAARGKFANREIEEREARLDGRINNALSGPNVGFGDIKRITEAVTLEFEQEERFGKMKFGD